MTTHTIDDLRSHLFETLRALRDKDTPMPIERAKAISDVAQTIINSAKVEVDMINAVGPRNMQPSGFMVPSAKPALEHASSPGAGFPPTGPQARP